MGRERLLIVDADLPRRLATYLECRGRKARSTASLGLGEGTIDPDLLTRLASRVDLGEWVLVTGDDSMPAEHSDLFDRLRPTVATIDPRRPEGLLEIYWRFDVVHRWAHRMQEQPPGMVRRYSLRGSAVWTVRKRHRRLA